MRKVQRGVLVTFTDDKGNILTKACNTCNEQKALDLFPDGKGYGGRGVTCIDCMYANPRIRTAEVEFIEAQWKAGSNRRFTPKYDSKGRRWLFAYENDEFRELALKHGWDAAKSEYGLNQFTLGLMKERLFSEEERADIDKLTRDYRKQAKKEIEDNLIGMFAAMECGQQRSARELSESLGIQRSEFTKLQKKPRILSAMRKYNVEKSRTLFIKTG